MRKKFGLWVLLIVFMVSLPVWAQDRGTAQPVKAESVSVETFTLENCLDLAYQNSQQLKAASKNVAMAEAGVAVASGGYWPTVSYQYRYLDALESPAAPSIPGMPIDLSGIFEMLQGTGYSGSVSITQPLYTGGKLSNSLKLARLKLASAVEDERKAKQQLTYSVKEAYYRLWLAEKMQGVAKSSYDNMERHYQRINSLYKAGTASRFDLLQAQVKWDNQKPSVIKAENGVKLARLSLATIIGIEPNREFQVEYDPSRLQLPEKVELSAQVVAEEAYQQRPELHQMQQLVEVAKANEALAKAGYLPNVALSYNYSLQGGSDIFLKNASNTVTLGVSLSGVAFDGFATPARVKSASENLELTRINEVNIKNQIRLETEQALQSLEESLETIRANQANIDLAQESLKMTQARFAAGMATTMDITDAQLVLDQASNGYYQGVSSYLTALAKLDLVAGKDQAQ